MKDWKVSAQKAVKVSLIPAILCAVLFLVSPSLNLHKIVVKYSAEAPIAYLREVAFTHAIQGYLFTLLNLVLCCYAVIQFGWRVTVKWAACTAFLFLILSYDTEFPTLGQLELVWSKRQLTLHGDIERYRLLLTFLKGWILSFLLEIASLHIFLKSRREDGEA